MTIIAAITTTCAEPPKLDRYRNEIAASLLGIKPHKANTEGLLALRRLAASAPDPDGDVVFLTSPRAINVVKACQRWVLGGDGEDDEEELEERVESVMLPIFMHLAPILQNVPGGPWAFVFDVLEGVLERASSTNKALEGEAGETGEDLIALTRALRLFLVLEELATRNKSLMAEWEGRRMGVLVIIRDLSVLGLGTLVLTDFVTLFDDLCFSTLRFRGCIFCTSFHMSRACFVDYTTPSFVVDRPGHIVKSAHSFRLFFLLYHLHTTVSADLSPHSRSFTDGTKEGLSTFTSSRQEADRIFRYRNCSRYGGCSTSRVAH